MYMYRNACIVIGWKGIHLLRVSFRKFAKGANSKETKHLGGGGDAKIACLYTCLRIVNLLGGGAFTLEGGAKAHPCPPLNETLLLYMYMYIIINTCTCTCTYIATLS